MANDVLSVKLSELDERISSLHRRIRSSQETSPAALQAEIALLRQECTANEQTLRSRLLGSRAAAVQKLAGSWTEIENQIQAARTVWDGNTADDADSEEKLLLAEYMLDFAMLAADHALLISLEAIATQLPDGEVS